MSETCVFYLAQMLTRLKEKTDFVLSVFAVSAIMTIAWNGHTHILKAPPMTQVTAQQIEQSREFLAECDYFKREYPKAALLLPMEHFVVKTPVWQEHRVCARYTEVFHSKTIWLYAQAMKEFGCYDSNPMITLAHEMLHQVRLPGHKKGVEFFQDPIERTIEACYVDAARHKRNLEWTVVPKELQ